MYKTRNISHKATTMQGGFTRFPLSSVTMTSMTYANSNELIGQNASELECKVLDSKHRQSSAPLQMAGGSRLGTRL